MQLCGADAFLPPSLLLEPPPSLSPFFPLSLVQQAEEKRRLFGDKRDEFVCLRQQKKSSLKETVSGCGSGGWRVSHFSGRTLCMSAGSELHRKSAVTLTASHVAPAETAISVTTLVILLWRLTRVCVCICNLCHLTCCSFSS